ncbi:NXPE family member 3-like [Strongylocentrotus purpuratus]|uniref:NXPE C-terminal domain-containing protein n=1 Tax=Strongylocentrotus purpuratus TaxID=7668 RepID=A0A7M7PX95_STRPU|nr:NXPE family member 3-like [Strongylocentrotus purpuratus]
MSSSQTIVNNVLSKFSLVQSKTVPNRRSGFSWLRKCFIAALATLVLFVFMWVFSASKRISFAVSLDAQGSREVKLHTTQSIPPLNLKSYDLDHLFDVYIHNSTKIKEYSNFNASLLTSAATSIFYPVRQGYEVGDTVEIRIYACDGMGRPQTRGGDFWFVRATSPNKHFRTAARLVDYQNGSYSAYFLAPLAGRLDLHVILGYPSDTVRWLSEVYMKADGCFTWAARYNRFDVGDGQGRCVVKRGWNYLINKNICIYGANETGMGQSAFICTMPEGFICDDIRSLVSYRQFAGIEQPVNQLIVGKKYLFENTFYKTQLRSPQSVYHMDIAEKSSTGMLSLIYDYKIERPRVLCGDSDSRNSSLLPEGYWLGPKWQSLVCSNRHSWDDPGNVKKCLAGHKIIMLGDSIACQWFRVLERKLGNKDVLDSFYGCTEDETHTVIFKTHVLSAALAATFNFAGLWRMFEPEYMDKLNDPDVKYVIFISMSAHYASWNMDSYRDRMRAIRNGIARMRARLGDDRVMAVIKKSQPREQPTFEARVHSNDYVFRQMSRIMEEEFVGINAKLIDTWDLVTSYQEQVAVHMPWPCINEEVDLFLSYICPS